MVFLVGKSMLVMIVGLDENLIFIYYFIYLSVCIGIGWRMICVFFGNKGVVGYKIKNWLFFVGMKVSYIVKVVDLYVVVWSWCYGENIIGEKIIGSG